MKSVLGALRHGRDLRHLPIALRPADASSVAAFAEWPDGSRIVVEHVPVALHPLTIALRSGEGSVEDAGRLVMRHVSGRPADRSAAEPGRDAASGMHVGREATIELGRARTIENGGLRFTVFEPRTGTNRFADPLPRTWAYLLARRRAAVKAGSPDSLGMTYDELRALDCYYVWPRPVYLVSVRHGDRSNLFPMDLVGTFGDHFTLALRTRSPSVETMQQSGRVVLSFAPAAWKDTVYQLGAHHRRASIDIAALPFALRLSASFGLPVPEGVGGCLEIELADSRPIGSHTFFVGRVVNREIVAGDDVPQLAHVSALYAGWRRRYASSFAGA